jgi:hypothetical protein
VSGYATRNGINYGQDGYAFCARCGRRPIVDDKCPYCDVEPTEESRQLARALKHWCYSPRRERMTGFFDGRPEHFDEELAARMLSARKSR